MSFVAEHILSSIIFLPIFGAAVLFAGTRWTAASVRRWAMLISLITLALTLGATWQFSAAARSGGLFTGATVLTEQYGWITSGGSENLLRIQYYVGLDGISLVLLLLTAFLTPLAVWGSFSGIRERHREYYALMLLLHGSMLGVFCARDLLLFYIFFEFTLIPLYFLIGIWGGPQREKAANMFFIYTLAGSMLTFAGVLYLGWKASLHFGLFTLELDKLYELAAAGALSSAEQWWLFLAFFAGFAIKVPLFPLHTWLPLAHTEAPTAGSVLLAGILLKLGTYGFLRFSLPMVPGGATEWAQVMAGLAIAGIIYGALCCWVQRDVKKLVAYSSVSHLGFCMLGMFSLLPIGLSGSVLYMVNHGISTGALFLVVGMIYERYHTRDISQLGGLARRMPILAFFLILFVLSSIGLPGLNGFVSEFTVLFAAFNSPTLGPWYGAIGATGILLGAIYMLHMAGTVLFGPVKEPAGTPDLSTGLSRDLNAREIAILTPLAVLVVLLGAYPRLITDTLDPALSSQILARVETAAPPAAADAVANQLPPGDFAAADINPAGSFAASGKQDDDLSLIHI